MAFTIGLNTLTLGNFPLNRNNTSNHQLMSKAVYTYAAGAGDYIDTIGFNALTNIGDGVGGVEIGLYDITSGHATATLVTVLGTIITITPNAQNTLSITPYNLSAGVTYAVGFRITSVDNIGIDSSFLSGDARWGTRTGTQTQVDWADGGNDDLAFRLFASGDTELTGSINPTGTDTDGQAGTSKSCVVQDLGGATPVSIALHDTVSGITTTQTGFSFAADTISYTLTRGELPYKGTLQLQVTLDSAAVLTLDNFELLAETGYQVITAGADPIIGTTESIAYDYTGDDPEAGYQFRVPLLTAEGGTLTLNTDLSYSVDYGVAEVPESDSISVEAWDTVSWDTYSATITFEAPAVPVLFTAVANGNFTDPATWDVGSGYPSSTDEFVIAGYTVVIEAADDISCFGTVSGTNISTPGTLEIRGNLTLTGDLTLNNWHVLKMVAGASLDYDSNNVVNAASSTNGGKLDVQGAVDNPVMIMDSSGTGADFIFNNATVTVIHTNFSNIDDVQLGDNYYGACDFVAQWLVFDLCGQVTLGGWRYYPSAFVVEHIDIRRAKAAAPYAAVIRHRGYNTPYTAPTIGNITAKAEAGYHNRVRWEVRDSGSNNDIMRSHIISDQMTHESVIATQQCFEDSFFRISYLIGAPTVEAGYSKIVNDCYFFADRDNPKMLGGSMGTVNNGVAEATYSRGYTDSGDHYIVGSGDGLVDGLVVIEARSGVLMNALGAARAGNYTARNCTLYGNYDVYGALARTESGGTFNGSLTLVNCIVRAATVGVSRGINIDIAGDDQVTTMDYNAWINIANPYYGVTSTTKTAGVTTGYGGNDLINVDPVFVDTSRNLQTWGAAVAGGSTPDDAINHLLKINGFNETTRRQDSSLIIEETVADLVQWVRDGFAPTAVEYETGYGGDFIGAIAPMTVPPEPVELDESSDVDLVFGATQYCVVNNVAGSAPVSIAISWNSGEVEEVQADFVWNSGTDTISYTATRGDLPYGTVGYELVVTLANAAQYTLGGVSLLPETGYQVIVAEADPRLDSASIAYSYVGDAPDEGYQFRVPLLTAEGGDLTLNTDLTYFIDYGTDPQPEADTVAVQVWDGASWTTYELTVNDEDVIEEPTTGPRVVSVNGGAPVLAGTVFDVVVAEMHAEDISSVALQANPTGIMYHCPIISVESATELTCQSPDTLPAGTMFTARAFLSKHAQKVRLLVADLPDIVTDAEAARDAAVVAQTAAELAALSAGTDGVDGNDGWSPVMTLVVDSERRVLQVTGWAGGEGTPPATGKYLATSGFVDTAAEAADIRGAQGVVGDTGPAGTSIAILGTAANVGALPGGAAVGDAYVVDTDGHLWVWSGSVWVDAGQIVGPAGETGADGDNGWSPVLAAVSDGERRVLQVISWTGGEGVAPTTLGYIGISGIVVDVVDAVDLRGETGPGADPLTFPTAAPRTLTTADQVSNNITIDLDCSTHKVWTFNFNGSPIPSTAGQVIFNIQNLPAPELLVGYEGIIKTRRLGRKSTAPAFNLPVGWTASWVGTPDFGNTATSIDVIVFYCLPDEQVMYFSISDGRR